MFLKEAVEEHMWIAFGMYVGLTIVGCVVLALPGVTFALIRDAVWTMAGYACLSVSHNIGCDAGFSCGKIFLKRCSETYVRKESNAEEIIV